MPLGPLTISVTSGLVGKEFSAAISGQSVGSTLEIVSGQDAGTPGFSTVNGRVYHSGLPFKVNTLVLRETKAGEGFRDSRIDIFADERDVGPTFFPQAFADAAAASGVTAYNVKRSNTFKTRTKLLRPDANFLFEVTGPSTIAGVQTPTSALMAVQSSPARMAAQLAAQGFPANHNSWIGCKGFYGGTQTLDAVKAGDSRIASTGSAAAGTFVSLGGNVLFPCVGGVAGSITLTPSTPVSKWRILSGNRTLGNNFTAQSGGSAAVPITSTAANTITDTTINCGSSGLHNLVLTGTGGTPAVLTVYGYDDTGGRTEICILNTAISGAISANMTDTSDAFGRNAVDVLGVLKPDLCLLADLLINDWRLGRSLAQARTNALAGIDARLAVGAEVILTTCRFDNDPAGVAAANQQAYSELLLELATLRDVPLIDLRASLVSFDVANQAGAKRYSDLVHGSRLGYNADAALFAAVLRQIMQL